MSGRCIICQEVFDPSEIAALKCGHTFHLHCVSQWLQNPNASCPVCRRPSRPTEIIQQLFFDYGEDSLLSVGSPMVSASKKNSELSKKVQLLEKELSEAVKQAKAYQEAAEKLEKEAVKAVIQVRSLRSSNDTLTAAERALRMEVAELNDVRVKNKGLEKKNKQLEEHLRKLHTIAMLVNEDGETDLVDETNSDRPVEALQLSLGIIKKKYNTLICEKQSMGQRLKVLERQKATLEAEKKELEAALKAAKEESEYLKDDFPAVNAPMKRARFRVDSYTSPPPAMRTYSALLDDSIPPLDETEQPNVRRVKLTNMTSNVSTPISNNARDAPVELDLGASPILPKKRTAARPGKSTAGTSKRHDGFGGRVAAAENAGPSKRVGKSKVAPQAPKPAKGRTRAPKIRATRRGPTPISDDSSVIILE